MKETYYIKRGENYEPISEYDSNLCDALPFGCHLVVVRPGVTSKTYNIDPAFAPMIAAGKYAEDQMTSALIKASEIRPQSIPLTTEQQEAWENLKKAFGNDSFHVHYPSAYDVIRAGLEAMASEAETMLSIPAVKKSWERFMFTYNLTKENLK